MNTTFVTAIYSQLSDGSIGRWDRYSCSLKSLMKCGANFVVFISPEDEVQFNTFVDVEKLPRDRMKIIVREIESCIWHQRFVDLKNRYESSGRSMDLVHSKIDWLAEIASENPFGDEYVYWIDAGLSFTGMFPEKYLTGIDHGPRFHRYTDLTIFSPDWVERLKSQSGDKIYVISLSTMHFLWTRPIDEKFYASNYSKWHIIGGLFGGRRHNMKWFQSEYHTVLESVLLDYEGRDLNRSLPVEEIILNVVVANNSDKFERKSFDTWYHADHEKSFDPYKRGTEFFRLFIQ